MLKPNSVQFYCTRTILQDAIEVYAKCGNAYGAYVAFEDHPEGSAINPLMKISCTDAQQLMDQLWHCGLRPSEGTGSAGAMAAQQRHLDDMRALVFNKLPSEHCAPDVGRQRI